MNEQWKQLKDTIVDIRDNNEFEHGDVTLMCRFLVNYMEVLEKQMQEPCEDAISREDALMCLTGEIKETDTIETIIARFVRRIRKLPPVNPQPCGDLISRKAILEEFENDQYHLEFCKEHHIKRSISMEMVRIRLHDLPPVNPQPCKDTRMIDKSNFNMEQYKTDIQSAYDCGKASTETISMSILRKVIHRKAR